MPNEGHSNMIKILQLHQVKRCLLRSSCDPVLYPKSRKVLFVNRAQLKVINYGLSGQAEPSAVVAPLIWTNLRELLQSQSSSEVPLQPAFLQAQRWGAGLVGNWIGRSSSECVDKLQSSF